MIYSKVIKASCMSHIQLFFPNLQYVEITPGYGDDYLIKSSSLTKKDFKKRFKHSILMSEIGYDIDLTNREIVLKLLHSKRAITEEALFYFRELNDYMRFWNAVKIYHICGIYDYREIKARKSFYPLFLKLGTGQKNLIREMEKLQNLSTELIFNSLLTMLEKIQNINDVEGLSWHSRRDLLDVGARISGIREKVYRYIKSDKERSDLLYLIIKL